MKIGDYCYVTYENNTYVIGKINYIDNYNPSLFNINVILDNMLTTPYLAWINSDSASYIIAESIDSLNLSKRISNKLNKALKMIVFQ